MPDLMPDWTQAMRAERYDAAWAIADAVLRSRDPQTRDDPTRPYHERWVWDGEPVDGRDVLVRCYHGLGDTLQFARFLTPLAQRAASVTLETQGRLVPLLRQIPGLSRIVSMDPASPLPRRDCDIEITELDLALRLPPSAASAPYLTTTRAILPEGTVALCHGAGEWDLSRSIPPELLAPLCGAAPCITLMPEETTLDVLNPRGCPLDIMTTASLIAGSSLIVTVDTMVAHLAGALGVPTWLMLKTEPDWRWAPDRKTSAWYPNTRLYVQSRPGDWPSVAEQILRDLDARNRRNGKVTQ
ncbi:hypothetical protein [Novosphingobium panipatense]|uniref:Glycosyl transferase family 9 (Putative heptosyltransferase) n=2 Tax=Novosphingobium panipatense TaxID=428991 RepID=A0ABY1PYG0_9SPHN|nr:hypothetical protein [Novosphingobium panipatense]SMP52883.1 hypothetical protein SAMN06296065_101343 [Novosphingobium panipatense]